MFEVTLAIDYGGQRVGLAASAGFVPTPLAVLPHGHPDSLVQRVLEVARREQATQLLVGWPLNMDGSVGPQAEKSRAFAQRLAAATSLPVFLWDERQSSSEAQNRLIESGAKRKARRELRDAYAAAVFLQEFYAQRGEGAVRVLPAPPPSDTPAVPESEPEMPHPPGMGEAGESEPDSDGC